MGPGECSLAPMRGVAIRALGPAELDRLEPLWTAMFEHHRQLDRAPLPFRTPEEAWTRRRAQYAEWIDEPDARAFVAEEAGETIGYAFARVAREQTTLATGRPGDLESLAVLPGHRGRGVGEALLATVLGHFRDLGVREWTVGVMEGNDRARALYERHGARPYVQLLLGSVPDA